jgi:hypothetical protein
LEEKSLVDKSLGGNHLMVTINSKANQTLIIKENLIKNIESQKKLFNL